MRKVLYFLTALLTFTSLNGFAQTYNCLSATSGTQVVAGVSIDVLRSTPLPNANTTCGVGPYQIGKNYSDWYQYNFNTPVTHVRLQFIRIHDDDTIRVYINGSPYDLNNATQSAFAGNGTCGQTSGFITLTPSGELTSTGHQTGSGQGIAYDISLTPNLIDSCRVEHIRHADNNIASDVYYNFCFADDSCSLGFKGVVPPTLCSGRDAQLDATQFPNTTYSWAKIAGGGLPPNWSPSANVRNPVLLNVNPAHAGTYRVTATRGVCVYTFDTTLNVDFSPNVGPVTQKGPVCPGAADTLEVLQVNLPQGGSVYIYDSFGIAIDSFDQGRIDYIFPSVQASDKHPYYVYAVTTGGCVSDTVKFDFKVNPDVYASFTYGLKDGCLEDTVVFTNTSTGDSLVSSWAWRFGDGSSAGIESPTHYYQVPKPDTTLRKYSVRLIVGNGLCFDTLVSDVDINHPLYVNFDIDKDSICQGDSITFTNNSFGKPGTVPKWFWRLGDGTTDTVYNLGHWYYNYAVYQPTLYITDFRGCVDSFKRTITVDSAGGIFFVASDSVICAGEEIVFTGDYSAAGFNSVAWDFGDNITIPLETKVKHSYLLPGTYDVAFSADYRVCPDTNFVRPIVVKPYPRVYIGEDTAICPNGDAIHLQASVTNVLGTVNYSWNTPTKDITSGIYVRHPGMFAVTAEADGCTASDTVVVRKNCYINIPNVFTPNGDGNGDYFLPRQILARSVTSFEMEIYNRWGEKVFETKAIDGRGWDGNLGGTAQPTGVYVYLIKVQFENGITERYQGNVTLLQ
ncbi:MAG: gliding motility-associated C-terminal domain-containing protein [Chitinophagaceae bacterium]|nr:gliding motility-associated C-terminal domain-containing protein [Chitinophagaceae bacterium]